MRLESSRLLKRLAVSSLDARLEGKLFFDLLLNQRMVFRIDSLYMLFGRSGVNQ